MFQIEFLFFVKKCSFRLRPIGFLCLFAILILTNCKSDLKHRESIFFNAPDSVLHLEHNNEITVSSKTVFEDRKTKIVNISWGECHVCTTEYPIWDTLVAAGHLGNAQVVFIAITENPKLYLKIYYPQHGLPGKVVFDNTGWTARLNGKDKTTEMLGTYLLDKENRILAKGNILKDPEKLSEFRQLIDSLP